MTERALKLVYSGANNKEFLSTLTGADSTDTKPGIFASDVEKLIFASIYYGWLICKYGNDWESNL